MYDTLTCGLGKGGRGGGFGGERDLDAKRRHRDREGKKGVWMVRGGGFCV